MDMSNTNDAGGNAGQSEGAGSNSGAALDFIREAINGHLLKASGAGIETLNAFRLIGVSLAEAKEITSGEKGAFGKWCDTHFKFSKEWRARLMKLAASWDDFTKAKVWAEEVQGRILGRKEYSVDGALGLIAEWNKAINPPPPNEGGEGEGEGDGSGPKQRRESAADKLRRELAEALERIRALEDELAKARQGDGAKGGEGAKSGPKPGAKEPPKGNPKDAPIIDAKTRAKAKKVWGLYTNGGTNGEKAAAKASLERMAESAGLSFADFLKACGLKD